MPRISLALLAAALVASGACQSSSTNVLGPSGTKCAISLPTSLPSIGAAGGPGTLTVTVAPECVWRASSDAEWISITANANGQGTGVVGFVASGNPTASMRRGAVRVGESRVELAQGGAPCQFNLTPATETFGTDGGEGVVAVSVIEGCQWSVASNASWLGVLDHTSGVGTGTVRYRADANTGSTRSGTLTIADRTFAVNQAGTGPACALTIGRFEQSVAASGGDDMVVVTSTSDCPWAVTSHAPWITIAGAASGIGSGIVRLSIAPNPGGLRVGLVTITGHTYIVTQAGATGTCFYGIGATGQSAPAAASTGTVLVSASSGCAWAAVSHAPWITITSGPAGNGSGIVVLAIATNTGSERVGHVTVAGLTYSVTQQAVAVTTCSYSISATQLSAPASGATSAVAVTAGGGCTWTAASLVNWIAITSGTSGTGNGNVNLAIAANTGAARSGAVTIAQETYTVAQAAGATSCSYGIGADDQSVTALGGPATVGVTATSGCGWTAVSQVPWITITGNASASGNATVLLTIALNTGAQRVGTVVVAGHTHTVTQAAAPLACSYSLNATDQSSPAAGGTGTVGVTTASGCSWTAESQAPWITVTSGAAHSGSGSVQLAIAQNPAAQRVGTVTIAGQTFTVTQAPGACTYSLNPTSQAVTLLGGDFSVAVTTQAGCQWTATTGDNWIQFSSANTGTGSGTLNYRVPLVSLGLLFSRTGTITISGHVLTVNQRALLSNGR